jgi:hypothetical protein
MRFILVLFALISLINCYPRPRRSISGVCEKEKDCEEHEYCDEIGFHLNLPNATGRCKKELENGHTCFLDKHCASKNCHHSECVARKPVRDGPCDTRDECIEEQFCLKKKCRTCNSWCQFFILLNIVL